MKFFRSTAALSLLLTSAVCSQAAGAKVVIHEIMYHPGFGQPGEFAYVPEDTRKEYIEIYNPGTKAVRLQNWRFTKGVSFTFPDVTIQANGYLVVAADSDTNRFKDSYKSSYPAVVDATVVGGWTGVLSNNRDDIQLEDNLGTKVDAVSYASEGDWAERREGEPFPGHETWWRGWLWFSGADAGGKSLELINPALPNQYGQNWAASVNDGGTPGGPNSVAKPEVAPFILEVRHRPVVPKSTDAVVVTTRIIDQWGTNLTVTLRYRVDGASTFTASPMFDDGQHGDGIGGDGVYGAILPAQADKTVVEFYVRASGKTGQARTWPGPTDAAGNQEANALYQVDNSTYAGNQPLCRVVVRASEWAVWQNLMDDGSSTGRFSDATMNVALVTVGGAGTELRYSVGARNRGKGTRTAKPHNLHLAIPKDRPWRNRTAIALNTRTVHSQVAGNAITAMAGLPNTYGVPAQVRVNGQNLAHLIPTGSVDSYQFGSYYWFQPYSAEWAADHLPTDSDANIYKGTWYFDWVALDHGADLGFRGLDPVSYRQAYSSSGPTSTSGAYTKQSNVSQDDWSDLINLTRVLNNTPDASYLEEVAKVVNIDEWLRYLAVTTLIGNMETTLGTGAGDDYSMYRGVNDPRFQILTHDLDTTLGQGDTGADYARSIFKAGDIPALNRFLKHPAIAPRYFAMLKELIETSLSPAQANPLLDQVLGGWVPDGTIQSMKDFLVLRAAGVLEQIPLDLAVTNAPSGYPRSTTGTIALGGKANAINTRSILVNGASAAWTPWTGTWYASNISLRPGLNRVVLQSLDGTGAEIDRSSIDVWYDRGTTTTISGGTLSGDTTWTAAAGPYRVTANLTIPAGRTLTVEPGTTVYPDQAVSIIVNGRLVAQGTEYQRIRFTRQPSSSTRWGGFQFTDAHQPSVLAYVDMEYGGTGGISLSIHNSQVLFDRTTFLNMDNQIMDIWEPQVTIRHCTFGDIGGHYMNMVEHMLPDGWFVIDGNLFGKNTGDNDIFHLNHVSVKGGATTVVVDNVFTGAGDDIVDDNETDTHIEGNLFMHAKELNSSNHGASAAVTTGPGGNLSSSLEPDNLLGQHLTVIRNVFYMNDYGIISKTGASSWIYNNVFVGNRGAIMFDEIDRTGDAGPGRSAYIESCIFWDNKPEDASTQSGTLVALPDPRAFETGRLSRGEPQVTVVNSILPATFHALGTGNQDVDPLLQHPQTDSDISPSDRRFSTGFNGFAASAFLLANHLIPDMRLQPHSPAVGTGFNGTDMGAYISTNATLFGVPVSSTSQTNVTLTVGGTDLYGYKFRVLGPGFDGAWSSERQEMKSVKQILLSGTTATATVTGHGYANGDSIEVLGADALTPYYNGTFTITKLTPDTFSYSVDIGTNTPMNQMPPKDIWCRKPEGIRLAGLAGGVYTLEVIKQNSLGAWQSDTNPTRVSWTVDTGLPAQLRLNEILAFNLTTLPYAGNYPDVVELFNPGGRAFDLAGIGLANSPASPLKFVFPPGAQLDPGQYLLLFGDATTNSPGFHLGFALNHSGDSLYLMNRDGTVLDSVIFGIQVADLSIGRLSDGQWALTKPTLGAANVAEPLAPPEGLRINEWLAAARNLGSGDYVELYNPGPLPAALGGLVLSDQSVGQPGLPTLPALSFIGAGGFAVFHADDQPANGTDHLAFTLSPGPGAIGLFDAQLKPIDVVFYGVQQSDISEGRSPNGADTFQSFRRLTPGASNPGAAAITNVTTVTFPLVSMTNLWRYNQTGVPPSNWIATNYSDDLTWPQGAALLYVENNTLPAPKNTPLTLGRMAYYFRTHFTAPTNLAGATLDFRTIVDDGAVFYLDGNEVFRIHMDPGAVDYATAANDHESALEGPFSFYATNLLAGDHVMAVEVHQVNSTSSDVVMGMSLSASFNTTNIIDNSRKATVLLNEILAHNLSLTNQLGAVTDWIELQNPSDTAADLSGMSLTDDMTNPRKWVFPAGAVLEAGGYWVVQCNPSALISGTNTGFGLDASGGTVSLFDTPAHSGNLLDAVTYGLQAADLSIGRVGDDGEWSLTRPTPRATNVSVTLGSITSLKVNEWMANPVSGGDWFELYNGDPHPVELSGLSLSQDLAQAGDNPIPSLSFIGAGLDGYQKFVADGSGSKGPNHTTFKLSAGGETIALFAPDQLAIDSVTFGSQLLGVSEGRLPDGSTTIVAFPTTPTPGLPNTLGGGDIDGDGIPDAWMTRYFGHPTGKPEDQSTANQDADGDGMTNLQEYLAGTNPLDPASDLRLTMTTDASVELSFTAAADRSYTVEYSDSLAPDNWQRLADIPALSSPPTRQVQIQDTTPNGTRYYRVRTPRLP